jgi:hypothetical protein
MKSFKYFSAFISAAAVLHVTASLYFNVPVDAGKLGGMFGLWVIGCAVIGTFESCAWVVRTMLRGIRAAK